MKRLLLIGSLIVIVAQAPAQQLDYKALFVANGIWASGDPGSLDMGVNYFPELSARLDMRDSLLIDADITFDLNANSAFTGHAFPDGNMNADPYRAWLRLSGRRFEVRAGLQKLNFGSASLLRPLMWFDALDPTDPVQFTPGVYGLLWRQYGRQNNTLWAWVLYGNKNRRGLDVFGSSPEHPEAGVYYHFNALKGELGLAAHYRKALIPVDDQSPDVLRDQYRLGFDARWDHLFGNWLEGSVIYTRGLDNTLEWRHLLTAGADYTFGIGGGLLLTAEAMYWLNSQEAFSKGNSTAISAISLSYPLGFSDRILSFTFLPLGATFNTWVISMLGWQHDFSSASLQLIAYHSSAGAGAFALPGVSQAALGDFGIQTIIMLNH